MPTVGTTSKPAYVYDAGSDTWIPIGPGEHSHSYIPNTLVDAKGDILTATAADTPARLAAGTNGQYLSSNSSTATGLEWVTASSGGMTLLETLTLSGASVTSSAIPSTYNDLRIIVRNYRPSTNAAHMQCRINSDSNARYSALNFMPQSYTQTMNETAWTFHLSQNSGANSTAIAQLMIIDYASATWKMGWAMSVANDSTTATNTEFNIYKLVYNQTAAISTLTFFPASGNFTSGSILIYGVK